MFDGISESVTFEARIFFKVVLFKTFPKIPACMDFALLSAESFCDKFNIFKIDVFDLRSRYDRKDRGPTPLIFFTVCPSPLSFPVKRNLFRADLHRCEVLSGEVEIIHKDKVLRRVLVHKAPVIEKLAISR